MRYRNTNWSLVFFFDSVGEFSMPSLKQLSLETKRELDYFYLLSEHGNPRSEPSDPVVCEINRQLWRNRYFIQVTWTPVYPQTKHIFTYWQYILKRCTKNGNLKRKKKTRYLLLTIILFLTLCLIYVCMCSSVEDEITIIIID